MPYGPVVLTLLSAIIGVFGKTWDSERSGIRRVTWKGWTVIALAVLSAGLTVRAISQERAEKAAFRQVALAQVVLATDQLLSPFRMLYVQYKGPALHLPRGPTSQRDGLAQLRTAIPVSSLTTDDFIAHLGRTDVESLSGDIRGGTRLPYLDLIAVRTAEGRTALEKALAMGGDLLPINVRTAAISVVQSPYGQVAEARPAALRRLSGSVPRTILPSAATNRTDVISEYKAYVEIIDSLRAAASNGT